MSEWISDNSKLLEALRQTEEEEKERAQNKIAWLPWQSGQTPLEWAGSKFFEGLEQLSTIAGAVLTKPSRVVHQGEDWGLPWEYIPGGQEYRRYQEWKGSPKESYVPMPWTSPWTEERAKVGIGDISEFLPWMLAGGGGGATKVPKAGEMLSALKPARGVVGLKKPYRAKPAQVEVKVEAALKEADSPIKLLEAPKPKSLVTGEPILEAPAVARPKNYEQLIEAHRIAAAKLLFNPKTQRYAAGYRRFAKGITGQSSMKNMTEDEARVFIEALKRLPAARGGKPPKIPLTKELMTEEFAEKIGMFKEIGFLEHGRPAHYVFEKMGLRGEIYETSEWAATRVTAHREWVATPLNKFRNIIKSPQRREAIMEALENPSAKIELSHEEEIARIWLRDFFDKWADDLGLAASKRRTNYVTHIFDSAVKKELTEKYGLDPHLAGAIDWLGIPKKINMPFTKQRLGREVGLVRDPFKAAEAYEWYATKQYYYEPLLQRFKVYERYLPPTSKKYLQEFTQRMTGRPLKIDKEMNFTLKEISQALLKSKIPGAKKLAEVLSRGNSAGFLAYNYTSMLYPAWLGFRPTSAIRNLGQQALAIADQGIVSFTRGLRVRFTAEGKEALSHSLTLASRKRAFLPGVDEAFQSKFMGRLKDSSMWMFKKADRENVTNSYLAGYSRARSLGLPKEWAWRYGDEVAMNTQYMYTQLGGAQWSQSAVGRALSPLTTWPENWVELMMKWASGRQSYVLKEYMAQTGIRLKIPQNWLARRKELVSFLGMVAVAYAIEKNTNLKATSYTGWSSIPNMARMIGGELPGLAIPGGMAEIVAGALYGDERLLKRGVNSLRPDQFIVIANQLENVMLGKSDWLSLFVYLNNKKEEKASEITELPELPDLPGLPELQDLPELPELPPLK